MKQRYQRLYGSKKLNFLSVLLGAESKRLEFFHKGHYKYAAPMFYVLSAYCVLYV